MVGRAGVRGVFETCVTVDFWRENIHSSPDMQHAIRKPSFCSSSATTKSYIVNLGDPRNHSPRGYPPWNMLSGGVLPAPVLSITRRTATSRHINPGKHTFERRGERHKPMRNILASHEKFWRSGSTIAISDRYSPRHRTTRIWHPCDSDTITRYGYTEKLHLSLKRSYGNPQ